MDHTTDVTVDTVKEVLLKIMRVLLVLASWSLWASKMCFDYSWTIYGFQNMVRGFRLGLVFYNTFPPEEGEGSQRCNKDISCESYDHLWILALRICSLATHECLTGLVIFVIVWKYSYKAQPLHVRALITLCWTYLPLIATFGLSVTHIQNILGIGHFQVYVEELLSLCFLLLRCELVRRFDNFLKICIQTDDKIAEYWRKNSAVLKTNKMVFDQYEEAVRTNQEVLERIANRGRALA